MVIDSHRPFWSLVAGLWPHLLPVGLYVSLISWLDLQYHFEQFNFPVAIVTALGTVIGLLLAFRTNSGYGRWWEARILWGAIVNDSRTWTRQLLGFAHQTDIQDEEHLARLHQMALRQAAWCFALSRSLRGQQPTTDLQELMDHAEIESYQTSHNVPNDILLRQAHELRELSDRERLDQYQFVELERTLIRLTNSMGGCERIKNTPFPASYSRLGHGLIYIFTVFLPFGLVNVPWQGLVFTSLSLSFAFLLIDRVATYLQDPFSSRPSDTPMLALSRTIEINIRQMLGQTELPPKLEPVNGVLY